MTRIRTLDFLPTIFQTSTNSQFLGATLDQLVNPPVTRKIDGFVGSKFGTGINANDYYVKEPTKQRTDYQLEPGVVFTKKNESVAKDFISYPGLLDALKLQNGITNNNDRLFNSQFYSWDSFTNLDMIINFNQYYWLPQGLPFVTVTSDNLLDVDTDILGQLNYTSANGIVFTNGLKVTFDGNVTPQTYLENEYYVQGVGTGIELIPVNSLIVPEAYTDSTTIPYDILPYDIGNFDGQLYIPVNPDYITIARNSINKNPWARSNRWFHIQVIQATASYLDNPSIITTYANENNKAKRPIIEFYPNIKLFNTGTVAKDSIDFIDTRTTNAFTEVAGQAAYYPDVQTYTSYTGTILTNPTVQAGSYILGQTYDIQKLDTTTLATWQDMGASLVFDGNFAIGTEYIITNLGTTDWNSIAGTTGVVYSVGDKFTAVNQGVVVGAGSGTALTVQFVTNTNGIYGSNSFTADTEYFITDLGLTDWVSLGATEVNVTNVGLGYVSVSSLVPGQVYIITNLGTTTQTQWNTIAGTTGLTYEIGTRFKCVTSGVGTGQVGVEYYISSLGSVTQQRWNNLVGTTNVTYNVGDLIIPVTPLLTGDGTLIKRQFTTNTESSGLPFRNVGTGQAAQGFGSSLAQTTTNLIINKNQVIGSLIPGMYINDLILGQESILPPNTRIVSITGDNTLTISVFWSVPTIVSGTTADASFVASTKNNADLLLYDGARIVFANENNVGIRSKIYVANYSTLSSSFPVLTLTEAADGQMLENDQFVVTRGQNNQGNSYYFDGANYKLAQSKPDINIQPKFDIFDNNGISFGDESVYESTTFAGCELFKYKVGVGANDSILGFPISYSSINNVGDITFEVSLNTDTFNYVSSIAQNAPVTQNVNTGYVYNYSNRTDYTRLLGWQTAVAPSTQYQIFEFDYTPNVPKVLLENGDTLTFTVTCDVGTLDRNETIWPNIQVYNNNVLLTETENYTVTFNQDSTVVNVFLTVDEKTVIQVLLLSDQVSETAYYSVPINLSNNPFNTDITTVDIGDIRGQYQSIFYNNPNAIGTVFGSNNTRDLGNLVPWGNRIIQNSASLVLPSAFLRNGSYSLFNALEYNSKEYIKFKTLLIDTINKTDYQQRFDPAFILDDALAQITSVKNQDMPFFWSDMLPNKAAYITNIYTVQNTVLNSVYPLSKIYNFTTANYDGVLVYLETTIDNIRVVKQLYRNIDYTVSTDSPSVIVTKDLIKNDKIIVKEYNQTYGSYVPNTPTKLGLYPATIPSVVLDTSYNEPTYFIRGHDGSYTKLYGQYIPETNLLVDYRDQGLLEFETRIYNNLKLSNVIPIQDVEVVPGYFRDTDFSYAEWLQMYTPNFLNWVGQNRLDYKTQIYLTNDQWTYNYKNSQDRLNREIIQQGYWRGIYQYYYDTTTPDQTPWEMIGYTNKPDWWENRYGPAPYTKNNLILWQDLENGIDYNNGNPVELTQFKRPGLTNIIPVNDSGELLEPFYTVVGNYNSNTLKRNWVVGDDSPVEFSYRRSSTYPFDLMRLYALTQPANFFNLAVDVDNYKYNTEFNQFLYNDRSHLVPNQLEIYGNGTAKTSYINWIVDYEKQAGVGATEKITDLLRNLDVRLVYRLAGFSDKTLLKFFVEKGSPESNNASLLIPDESYQVLLYENQPYNRLTYSSVVIQKELLGYRVYGNSQNIAYFTVLKPILNGNTSTITVQDTTVEVANDYYSTVEYIPYGTLFYSTYDIAQFLMSYGKYLQTEGFIFDQIENGIEITWNQMVAEFLYWSQVGWQIGSIVTLNPSANKLLVNKESTIVQPLVFQQNNFILNQNLYPINNNDLCIFREGSEFRATPLNGGDSISYAQFNMSNIEHGIVFDNITLFNDVIYNLVSGLKQNRIYLRGTKSAEWNGTMFASGFIYNQDNIQEYSGDIKYTKGSIVKYKNKYWTALKIIQPNNVFSELDWKETEYDEIQKGLLPNPSTRSYESALYYNIDKANLEQDADQLSFSLIGFRPRPYMESADLTDITQVNVYKNMIKEKGTKNTLNAFRNAQLPQGNIDYDIYENWAILSGTFGGVVNNNFIEFKLNESKLTGNPSIVGLTDGNDIEGAEQLVPIYSLFNYSNPVTDTQVLPTTTSTYESELYPNAGYVNINDVKMSSYSFAGLSTAVDKNDLIVTLNQLYVNDYVWLADYLSTWQILTPYSIGQVLQVRSNLNGTSTVTFNKPHNLTRNTIFSIVNFDASVNGYYVAEQIISPYQVLVLLNLGSSNRQITGQGIVLGFNNNRVSKPSDIQNLPLLNYEFTKYKAWVDQNTDGNWAVYRKSINYLFDKEFTKVSSDKFGAAVNYNPYSDLLISDTGLGTVYRYQYDTISNQYNSDQTFIEGDSFGTSIVNAANIIFVSKPTGLSSVDRFVKPYIVNTSIVSDNMIPYQYNNATVGPFVQGILAPTGCTNFGQSMAVSEDGNYLYVSDFDTSTPTARNKIHVYRKNNIEVQAPFVEKQTYQISELGTTDFTDIGAVENKVGIYFIATGTGSGTGKALQSNYELVATIDGPNTTVDKFGYSLSTNYYGDTLVVGAPYTEVDSMLRSGKAYIYQRIVQNFEAQSTSTGLEFGLCFTPNSAPISVYINGTYVQATEYNITGNILKFNGQLNAGDIITAGSNEFVLVQTLETSVPKTGLQFGTSVDNNIYGTEILIGAPFELTNNTIEGAVYRYTYGSARFGYITGTNEVNVSTDRILLINGYKVTIPAGTALQAASTINLAKITNVVASANNNILTISLLNNALAQVNQELLIGVTEIDTLSELGFNLFTNTQTILCPHPVGSTQFGTNIKFNEQNSIVVSAVTGTRFTQTTFDFTDDENLDNDTVFDNNSTQFLDTFANAGAVYMFDYLENYNETLDNIGAYTYAQSCNSQNLEYGQQPLYGTALDFADNKVIIGTPNYRPTDIDGQVIVYSNNTGIKNWSVYRQSNPVVDINSIQNTQLFSAETNNTLINLDYMDPLQGKLLGAIRENIDVVSNIDPASYNNVNNTQTGFVWGTAQVGTVWFDTSTVRFVNYHQNDNTYNARYWGTLFPGSDVRVYSWVASNVPPVEYQGPGTPRDTGLFTVQTVLNSSNQVTPVYYFWVRDTGIVFPDKTLADITVAEYINNPQSSGISYMTPILPDAFALYNVQTYINANDTVLHIGYNTSNVEDVAHTEYTLIREDFPSDFLPGLPNEAKGINYPESLYDRLLDSLSGTDEIGSVVPDPFLPKAVQSGVLVRPKQSFFYNRFTALQNYLQYANSVMLLYPITEIRRPTFLNESGAYYNVADFYEYVNWWAVGYNDNTKSALQVQFYADLSTLNVPQGTIVTVAQNSQGLAETYIYNGEGIWNRIGLQNGTIRFKDELYDYALGKYGFGGDFFSTAPFDQYPSEETRWIVRAINEQIFTNDLLIYRNKGLILLFNYIQSETHENQNYLPWLNKTSLVDVSHTIRELKPLQNFVSDNQEFLSGYVNEAKPYHVVIKEFLFEYKGTDVYQGNISDFDLPATYDTNIDTFVSPQLVYNNSNTPYEFLPDSAVWDRTEYNQWFNNYGVSLSGQNDYYMTNLASYVTLASNFLMVDNISGFPVQGVIKIADVGDANKFEFIGYNSVDKELNMLLGLVRGVNGSEIYDHIPGEKIYIDLPKVLVLNGGKNYTSTPNVTAYIDTVKYPLPKEEMVLEAVMDGDKVSSINVINDGLGYAVTPEIIIDPSIVYDFDSIFVDLSNNTIQVFAPELATGDLVKYTTSNNSIGGLKTDQYYYVNVLETVPNIIIALYTTYIDCVNDNNRVAFISTGSGTQSLQLGARAIPITTSSPVRENNITLRFDRTSYDSQVTNWEANSFYAGNFMGSFENNINMSSSNIELSSVNPDINNILASNGGIVFPIESVTNDRQLVWSSFERNIQSTNGSTDVITLDVDISTENASGSTIGFTVGMPVKFTGVAGTSNIVLGTTYYISEIINNTQFKISSTQYGTTFDVGSFTPSTDSFKCLTAQVIDTAVVSVVYPGIRNATATNDTNNTITVPLDKIGTGGTQGLYTGLSVVFTGNTFGNVEENVVYFVASVIDEETFTISENSNPLTIKGTSINTTNQLIVSTTTGLNVNDKIIFNSMSIDGVNTSNFGNIIKGNVYYVKEIGVNVISLSETIDGPEFVLSTIQANAYTYAFFTSQEDTVDLATATGNMTMNIQMPVSPGQVNGQELTFYQTSIQYPNITGTTFGNLVEQTVEQVLASPNRIAIDGNMDRLYNGFSFRVADDVGGLYSDRTYYMTGLQNLQIECASTSSTTSTINANFNGNIMTITSKTGTDLLYKGTLITGTGLLEPIYITDFITGSGGLGTYTINTDFFVYTELNGLTASTGIITTEASFDTNSIYEGMPAVFSGNNLGGIQLGLTYYVRTIINSTQFTISALKNGASAVLGPSAGNMTLTGAVSANAYLDVENLEIGDTYDIQTIGTTNFTTVGATLETNGSFAVGITYVIQDLGTTLQASWNSIAGTIGVTYNVNDTFTAVISGSGAGNGKAYRKQFTATSTGIGTGTALVQLTNDDTQTTLTQEIISNPTFDISYILGGYRAIINNGGTGFTIDNTITINGSLVGGITPDNNVTLTVDNIYPIVAGANDLDIPIESNGQITNVSCLGTPSELSNNYYLKVKTANSFEVYSDSRMTVPVSGLTIPYTGFTTTVATNITAANDRITVSNSTIFNINDPVVFTGNIFTNEIVLGNTYYIFDKPTSTTVRLTDNPGGTVINFTTDSSGSMSMTTAGSYMLLSTPFYVNSSIVKYNNRVYACVVSNNDSEFVFGKWEELNSGDRRLNAMDRVIGYYQPTDNMPGVELEQLFDGVTYPNTTYKGNTFDLSSQHSINTNLQDQVFYPTNVNLASAIFNGTNYVAVSNMPTYSGLAADIEISNDWLLAKLADQPMSLTDILYVNNKYILTANNTAIPLLVSNDGTTFSADGYYVPYLTPEVDIPYVKTKLIASDLYFNSVIYGNGKYVFVGKNITTTSDLALYKETYKFSSPTTGELYGVAYINNNFYTGFLAVGYQGTDKTILYSTDGLSWTKVSSTAYNYGSATVSQQNATLNAISYDDDSIVVVGEQGVIYKATSLNNWTLVQVANDNLNAITFADNTFVAVGDQGIVYKSNDAVSWILVSTPTVEDLNDVVYATNVSTFTIVGNNNTVLQTTDINAISVVYDTTEIFSTPDPVYTVQGDIFQSGYAPEELVAGVVTDQLTMIVTTRPGTNWPAEEYAHVGYNVVSTELDANIDNTYSFDGLVNIPAQLSVFVTQSGLSTTIYETLDYTVDWVNKTIELNTNITGSDKLRIDVYEVGNGDQLVKSNTDNDPIINNSITGFDEIYLSCNYAGQRINGGGIVHPDTGTIDDVATQTESTNDLITVLDTSLYQPNDEITFAGTVFGGVVEGTIYYVKSVNVAQSAITISDSLVGGIAGPVYSLTNGNGSMTVIIQTGPGDFYTMPAVYHNGVKLVPGHTNTVFRTKSSNNAVVTYTTLGLLPNQKIVFGDNMIGSLTPHQTYYIKSILNGTEFTVSNTIGGTTISLTDGVGTAIFVTEDYAASTIENSLNAKIILSENFDISTDYLAYSFFTETEPAQYGYTIPETQVITSTGSNIYTLTNFINEQNSTNAIVEIDGRRIMPAVSIPYDTVPYGIGGYDYDDNYYINPANDTITFYTTTPTVGQKIAITTFNDTQRQYLNTQYGVIANATNTFTLITTYTVGSSTTRINVTDTENLIVGTPVIFTETGVSLGAATTIPEIIAGTQYYITDIDLAFNTIAISQQRNGPDMTFTAISACSINLTQWEQDNVDRLWVTVNGYRVPSSNLVLGPANEVTILSPAIVTGDEIIITSMMPSASPDSEVYMQLVDKNNQGTVYRANNGTKTYVTQSVTDLNNTIVVNDLSNITNTVVQTNTTPVKTLNYYLIPLNANKNDISDITVYNNNITRLGYIPNDFIQLEVSGTGPYVKIYEGSYIETGDSLTITTIEGKIIYINGEYMRIDNIDTSTNTLTVTRGINLSVTQNYIPEYSVVYSLLESNKMPLSQYNQIWSPIPGTYNTTKGDPLQISDSNAAIFLNEDN